jgi:hypothetical protein
MKATRMIERFISDTRLKKEKYTIENLSVKSIYRICDFEKYARNTPLLAMVYTGHFVVFAD